MHYSVIQFFVESVQLSDVKDKTVLEIGSYNVNGGLREIVEKTMECESYTGTDIRDGPGVDIRMDAADSVKYFGLESFDVVICTEMLEHVEKWQEVIFNIKSILKLNGLLILTTRSPGFPYHEHPSDFWRFTIDDMRSIFSDFIILELEDDPQLLGVFVKAKKPELWDANAITEINNIKVMAMEK